MNEVYINENNTQTVTVQHCITPDQLAMSSVPVEEIIKREMWEEMLKYLKVAYPIEKTFNERVTQIEYRLRMTMPKT